MRTLKGVGDLLPEELRESMRQACEAWNKMTKDGDPIPAVSQTPEQIADMTWHCPTCRRSVGLLRSLGKTTMRDGYLQCVDCFADIDCASLEPKQLTEKDFHDLIKELFPDCCPPT